MATVVRFPIHSLVRKNCGACRAGGFIFKTFYLLTTFPSGKGRKKQRKKYRKRKKWKEGREREDDQKNGEEEK